MSELKNVTISRKPRNPPTEIPDTYSKYKKVEFESCNFEEIVNKATQGMTEDEQDSYLMELGLHELQRCFSIFRHQTKEKRSKDRYLDFKSVDNNEIIKELSIFAEKFPQFILMNGQFDYPSLEDVDDASKPYIEVHIANGKVQVYLA